MTGRTGLVILIILNHWYQHMSGRGCSKSGVIHVQGELAARIQATAIAFAFPQLPCLNKDVLTASYVTFYAPTAWHVKFRIFVKCVQTCSDTAWADTSVSVSFNHFTASSCTLRERHCLLSDFLFRSYIGTANLWIAVNLVFTTSLIWTVLESDLRRQFTKFNSSSLWENFMSFLSIEKWVKNTYKYMYKTRCQLNNATMAKEHIIAVESKNDLSRSKITFWQRPMTKNLLLLSLTGVIRSHTVSLIWMWN